MPVYDTNLTEKLSRPILLRVPSKRQRGRIRIISHENGLQLRVEVQPVQRKFAPDPALFPSSYRHVDRPHRHSTVDANSASLQAFGNLDCTLKVGGEDRGCSTSMDAREKAEVDLPNNP